MEAKSVLVTPAIPFIAGIPYIPAVESITYENGTSTPYRPAIPAVAGVPAVESITFANGTSTPYIPAIPEIASIPAQQGVAAVYSEPSWILSGQPYKFGFVQSIDSITLTTDEYVGYTEHTDVSNVLTFVDHLGH